MNNKRFFMRFCVASLVFLSLLIYTCAAAAAPVPDTQAPTAPTELTVIHNTYTSITLSWNDSKDNVKVKGYQIFRDGKKITSSTKTVYTNTNLAPGKKYTYAVKAYDAADNISAGSIEVSASTIADTQNPTAPKGLSGSAATYTSIALTWNPSTDNTSIKGYEVYCNGKKKSSTASAGYVVKSLAPGTSYTFYVKAYDIAGNYSPQSTGITCRTVSDVTPPSAPSGLKATSSKETEINLAWSPSADNVKVKCYDIFRDGKKLVSTTKTTYCNKALAPGVSYTYTVKAIDSSGNVSGGSNSLKASTLTDSQAPTAPTGLKISSLKGSAVSLTWTASKDNVKVKGYQIYCNGIVIETSTRTTRSVSSPFGLGVDVYWIKAYDQSGNISAGSNVLTVITPVK